VLRSWWRLCVLNPLVGRVHRQRRHGLDGWAHDEAHITTTFHIVLDTLNAVVRDLAGDVRAYVCVGGPVFVQQERVRPEVVWRGCALRMRVGYHA